MAIILLIIGGMVAIVGFSILRGFVLSYLWSWFLTPLGLPEIGIAHAIGIAMVIAFVTAEHPYSGPEDEAWGRLGMHILAPFFALLFGYIVHSFM